MVLLDALSEADELLTDRSYDADWFRNKLLEKEITSCIPSRRNRKEHIPHDKERYKQRHKIEDMFGRLKDCRRTTSFGISHQPDLQLLANGFGLFLQLE